MNWVTECAVRQEFGHSCKEYLRILKSNEEYDRMLKEY